MSGAAARQRTSHEPEPPSRREAGGCGRTRWSSLAEGARGSRAFSRRLGVWAASAAQTPSRQHRFVAPLGPVVPRSAARAQALAANGGAVLASPAASASTASSTIASIAITRLNLRIAASSLGGAVLSPASSGGK